ncbi:MAG: hypothetical protein QOD02_4442, partial [Mycobacterium sp.]|nr:hypothetical protein [Mycobacterium sp.]
MSGDTTYTVLELGKGSPHGGITRESGVDDGTGHTSKRNAVDHHHQLDPLRLAGQVSQAGVDLKHRRVSRPVVIHLKKWSAMVNQEAPA